MSEVHVIAIVTPAPGKHDRLRELIGTLTKKVEANEADVIKYQAFEQVNGEGVNVFVFEECYKDQAALDAHMQTDYFRSVGKQLADEGVLAAPLDIKVIKPISGFTSR